MIESTFTQKEVLDLLRRASGLLEDVVSAGSISIPEIKGIGGELSRAAFFLGTVDFVERGKPVYVVDPRAKESVTVWKVVSTSQLEETTRAGWRLPKANVEPIVGAGVLFLVFKVLSEESE